MLYATELVIILRLKLATFIFDDVTTIFSISLLLSSVFLLYSLFFTAISNVGNEYTALAICNVLNKSTCPEQGIPSHNTATANKYQFMKEWGSQGSGDGQFNSPRGIAVDPLGNVYVTDTGNNRVQKFDSNGTFVSKWNSTGSGNTFHAPEGIAIYPLGNVYVTDTGGNGVQKYISNGTLIGGFVVCCPKAITTDILQSIYVAQSNNQIVKNPVGDPFFSTWGNYSDFKFTNGVGVAVDSLGNVYVADTGNNRIEKFTINGTLITTWGKPGRGDGQFISPLAIAVDASDNVYLADTGNNRIQKFDSNATFITKIGSAGTANGHFLFPAGVAVDLSDNLYVVDRGNNRIQVFAATSNAHSR
jgi:tripartite motif-containing protein 71